MTTTDWNTNLTASAAKALQCLDLTSLNDGDTEADIERLCARAQSPHGSVAAVCVWPRLAAFARSQLPPSIAVAAVANFPDGSADIERAVRDTAEIVQAGAQEVDVVLPWRQLLAGDAASALRLLQAVRKACDGLRLKVILETGELRSDAAIAQASRLALDAGAHFLKTSTGKTATSATPQAARILLTAIADDPALRKVTGFKPSGGIRTVADAASYLWLTQEILGAEALTPQRFRIGASSVLADIEATLSGQQAPAAAAPGSY
ncbi:deoxyribose-phosphate aldolase [Curvibacter sp. APW13]|uniref:deoxyribose-phosphate aldolase n=1 Tax=Curvibacter sp. APW13 TaxID=3077236 RepID=UPI0028DF43A1|nr:deoxyribose-phosphate aldolase [Curvibacter sp. APW13]MDT8992314.1 deoxyribose-phosphate aldolase [Curvibacter sp. APW13]